MATDLFNNPSNDYINPGLAPCAGTSDSYTFEFLSGKEAGVISGSEIIQSMDLSDISIPITSWINEKKTLASGEVIYVPGLTKGLLNRTQFFDIPATGYVDSTSPYYMILDISINYYYNFKYYNINVEASSNANETISIVDAMNSTLSGRNISATLVWDPSYFKFTGNTEGWDFDITNVVLTLIDSSTDNVRYPDSPFVPVKVDGEVIPQNFTLVEDTTSEVPYAKYPNGGQLGYLLKTTFPSTATSSDKWIYMNTVESPYTVFEAATERFVNVDSLSLYESLDYDASLVWPPNVDVSVNSAFLIDLSIADVSIGSMDASIWDPSIWNMTVDGSIITAWILDSSITNSSISNSHVKSSYVRDGSLISDSSVLDSIVINTPLERSKVQDTSVYDTSIASSIFKNVDISGGVITLSVLKGDDTTLITNSTVTDSSLQGYVATSTNFTSSVVLDTYLEYSTATTSVFGDSSLLYVNLSDSSIVNCYIIDSSLERVFVDSSDGTYIARVYANDSVFKNSVLNNDTSIFDSSIYNSWTNAYLLPTTVPTWYADSSTTIVYITESEIMDVSINNAWIYDSSIWVSRVEDSSLIRCTIYNSDISDTTTRTDCKIITVNASFDASMAYELDGSTYYQKFSKKIDVGRSGEGTATILSAADYLDYINTYDLWEKAGPLMAQISAPDPTSSTQKNLVGGFYIYNPHTFTIKVEYMLIN